MFRRVTMRVCDLAAAERFYGAVLGAAGIPDWDDFALAAATADSPPTRRLHIGFAVASRAHVDAFWQAGIDAGCKDDGAPGPRDYTPGYYGGFLVDPEGNSAEAVHHDGIRRDGNVDHLWIRVADVQVARRFYVDLAPRAGLELDTDTAQRVSFARPDAAGGGLSLVAGAPTENVDMALAAAGDAAVLVDPDGNRVELLR